MRVFKVVLVAFLLTNLCALAEAQPEGDPPPPPPEEEPAKEAQEDPPPPPPADPDQAPPPDPDQAPLPDPDQATDEEAAEGEPKVKDKPKPAAQDPDEVSPDKYSGVSEQKLLLTGEIVSSLPQEHFNRLYSLMGLGRFHMAVEAKDPNDPAVEEWCESAVQDTQVRRDEVDGETGDAVVSLKAKIERCSQVFKHDVHIDHTCERKVPEKGDPYMDCEIKTRVTIYKYKADQSSGKLHFSLDREFGVGGKVVKEDTSGGAGTISGDTTEEEATDSALKTASVVGGLFIKRKLRDIKEFQLHTPVVKAKDGWALGCLGKDTAELDTPFNVIVKTPKGEVRTGFVKARRIYDGCTLTPSMKTGMKQGHKYELKPMESEIILGGSNVKAGHTMWELPSIGLNVGGFGGINGSVGFFSHGNIGPGGGLALEFNLAPFIGISELHIFEHTTIMGVLDDSLIVDAFNAGGETSPIYRKVTGATLAIHTELGLLKRFYLAGPFFAELGASFTFSAYFLETVEVPEEESYGLMGIGGTVLTGLGFQLTPRLIMKLNMGYFFAGTLVTAETGEDETQDYSDTVDAGAEHGPVAKLVFLYNI